MNLSQILARFPKASEDFIAANFGESVNQKAAALAEEARKVNEVLRSPIRQKRRGGPSKLELDFLAEMREANASRVARGLAFVLHQAITLRIGNGVTYTPDVWKIVLADENFPAVPMILAYEVKGPHFWPAAKVKLKAAASAYPFIEFHLVRKTTGKSEIPGVREWPWIIERVMP